MPYFFSQLFFHQYKTSVFEYFSNGEQSLIFFPESLEKIREDVSKKYLLLSLCFHFLISSFIAQIKIFPFELLEFLKIELEIAAKIKFLAGTIQSQSFHPFNICFSKPTSVFRKDFIFNFFKTKFRDFSSAFLFF